MRTRFLALLLSLIALASLAGSTELEHGFANPPDSTKPWCYWYWISDNISREGITRDLEAMKRVGIGEAFIGNIFLDDVKTGTVKALSEEWWEMVEHAIREGGRIGVDIGMFNCPGWSQSGGPWIKPEQAMRYVAITEQRVKGRSGSTRSSQPPKTPFQDIAVLAFPAPREESTALPSRSPQLTCKPPLPEAQRMVDGDRNTEILFPPAGQGRNPLSIDHRSCQPASPPAAWCCACSAPISPRNASCRPAAEDGVFKTVRSFPCDRSNNDVNVGFLPYAPVAISFPPVTAKTFRLIFTDMRGKAGLAEIELSGAARVERFIEKQLAKMHPTPLPMWDAYLWPPTAEPDSPAFAVEPASVLDLTGKISADGTLHWDVPEGEWIVLRAGMTPTGTRNAPASPEGQGLEVDKMNRCRRAARISTPSSASSCSACPRPIAKHFKHVVADSYEMGSQNWTDGLRKTFRNVMATTRSPGCQS